jgi:hypothetical protein
MLPRNYFMQSKLALQPCTDYLPLSQNILFFGIDYMCRCVLLPVAQVYMKVKNSSLIRNGVCAILTQFVKIQRCT